MKKSIHSSAATLLLCFLSLPPALAVEVDLNYGQRQGDVTYQIGGQVTLDTGESGYVRFPLSELRFPLDTPIANVKISHQFSNDWLLAIRLNKNLSSSAGDMQDSDWGVNFWDDPSSFPRDSLDIYSESRSELDGGEVRLEVLKKVHLAFLPQWSSYVGGGLLLQEYNFEIFDTVQSYPSTPEQPDDIINGKNLTYRYEAQMPFISAMLHSKLNDKTYTTLSAAYSPILHVADYDNHILRNKTSRGDSDGWGLILEASVEYALQPSIKAYLGGHYSKTVANGIQTQVTSEAGSTSELQVGLRLLR